jgi:hypothetical protein
MLATEGDYNATPETTEPGVAVLAAFHPTAGATSDHDEPDHSWFGLGVLLFNRWEYRVVLNRSSGQGMRSILVLREPC